MADHIVVGKRQNALRDYHLLVVRQVTGFVWEIRYDRHAKPIRISAATYTDHDQAELAGRQALDALKREADPPV